MYQLATLALMLCSFLVAYLTMTLGWGLEVKSWLWLIGGTILNVLMNGFAQVMAKNLPRVK